MGHKRYTPEQIIGKLRQAEVRSAEGATVAEFVRELGITEQTTPSGARRNSVSVSDSAHRCRLLLTTVAYPETRRNQRSLAPVGVRNRHGVLRRLRLLRVSPAARRQEVRGASMGFAHGRHDDKSPRPD